MKNGLKKIMGLAMAGSLAGCGVQTTPPFAPDKSDAAGHVTKAAKDPAPKSLPSAKILGLTVTTTGENYTTLHITEFRPASMPDKICIAAHARGYQSGVAMQCFDSPKGP